MRLQTFRADRLRREREAHGLTQHELSRQIGAGLNQITRYENGLAEPSVHQLKQIAKVLQVTTDYLLGLVDDKTQHISESDLTPDERKFIYALREGKLRTLLGMIQQALPDEKDQPQIPGVNITPHRKPLDRT
jgi:transcriptional regulator with XRE-family HTH domain